MCKPSPRISALLCLAAASLVGTPTHAEEGASSSARWVSGSAVNLRAQASTTADVLTRMALNTRVELIGSVEKSPYCEVSATMADGRSVRGFTACEYLAAQPIDVHRITTRWREDGSPNPDYDPAKTFDISPSWSALAAYANLLNRTRLTEEQRNGPLMTGVRPDPLLERMKAHLAKGIYGPAAVAVRRLGPTQERSVERDRRRRVSCAHRAACCVSTCARPCLNQRPA